MSKMKSIYVALDNMSKEDIYAFLERSNNEIVCVKIGLELFNLYGRDFVEEIYNKYKVDIFLDLKLHDIPNTVSKAIRSLKGLPIKFLTLHLSGGINMLKASVEARNQFLPECKLLGVSILTSLDQKDIEKIWGISDNNKLFSNLFQLAHESQVDGVVCSPNELMILNGLNLNLLSMCPGIRFDDEIKEANFGDQKRVLSPEKALEKGASFLVMGRSLTQSKVLTERIQLLKSM